MKTSTVLLVATANRGLQLGFLTRRFASRRSWPAGPASCSVTHAGAIDGQRGRPPSDARGLQRPLHPPDAPGAPGRHDPSPVNERARPADEPAHARLDCLAARQFGQRLLTVAPGQTQNYEIRLPTDHPAGLYWYHPHPHGFSDEQTRNGMSGALIVEGTAGSVPDTATCAGTSAVAQGSPSRERTRCATHIARTPSAPSTARLTPRLCSPRRDRAVADWQLGADSLYQLTLDGHRFQWWPRDGIRRARLEQRIRSGCPPVPASRSW